MSAQATSNPDAEARLMKVGELARITGKTVRALRLYEEMGLLAPQRSGGGFRLYGPDELARVGWITKLQDIGFSLAQIQGLLGTVESSDTGAVAMQGLRETFRSRLADTRAQVEKLLQLERDLSESLAYLEGCRACTDDHNVGACVGCQSVHVGTKTPSLVAGVHLGGSERSNASASASASASDGPLVQLRADEASPQSVPLK